MRGSRNTKTMNHKVSEREKTKRKTGHVFVQQLIGSANASEPEESGRSSPPTQQPSQDAPHPHIPSGHPHAPPQQSSFGTSTRPQADRASSCRPPPLDPPNRSMENKQGGRTVMFVGSISAERFFGGCSKVAARQRKASKTPPKGSCCELCPGSGRAIPPKRSMQWGSCRNKV